MNHSTRINEVADYIQHGDSDLGIRRMLDLAWDLDNLDFIRQTIDWSKAFRASLKANTGTQLSISEANTLLGKAQQLLADTPSKLSTTLLLAKGITKKYAKGNFNLKPLDLNIEHGEVLGIVGENGNGKTTLLRLLAGQLTLSGGSITYGFSENDHPDYYTIKQNVSFVPQRIPRWYGLLKDNLHFSASIAGLKGLRNEVLVDFMFERLNLSDFSDLTWDQISSGYKTRFEMARVLLQRPQLLMLDEPLANLDINAQQTLLTDLRFMAKSTKNPMAILLSSQQLYEVEKTADSVLFLKKGECLYRTGAKTEEANANTVIEIETLADRSLLSSLLGSEVQLGFNGGYYTLTSTSHTSQQLFKKLAENEIHITYLRDITHSTKRFF